MRQVVFTNQFKKDYKLCAKRHLLIKKLQGIISQLQQDEELAVKHRNHALSGNYANCMECHVQPDWLLIYKIVEDELHLLRTGTHADLFR